MTRRSAPLPLLPLLGALLLGCDTAQRPGPGADDTLPGDDTVAADDTTDRFRTIPAGVTTVHSSSADTVQCDDGEYQDMLRRVPEAARTKGPGEAVEIRLDRSAGTLTVSDPAVQVKRGGQLEWVSEHDWVVLFMKSPSSPLQNHKRVVEPVGKQAQAQDQQSEKRGRGEIDGDAACGKFDYTVVVQEGGRMYTLDPEVWVMR